MSRLQVLAAQPRLALLAAKLNVIVTDSAGNADQGDNATAEFDFDAA
jgi:hypothetical protein